MKGDPGYKEWLAFVNKYMPNTKQERLWLNVYGYTIAQTSQVPKQRSRPPGFDLTRANVIKRARPV